MAEAASRAALPAVVEVRAAAVAKAAVAAKVVVVAAKVAVEARAAAEVRAALPAAAAKTVADRRAVAEGVSPKPARRSRPFYRRGKVGRGARALLCTCAFIFAARSSGLPTAGLVCE